MREAIALLRMDDDRAAVPGDALGGVTAGAAAVAAAHRRELSEG